MGVQATGSQGHPSRLPRHSSSQCQEPSRSTFLQGKVFWILHESQKNLITGNGRASPLDGNLCSLLNLGRPQLKQVTSHIFLAQLIFLSLRVLHFCNLSRLYPVQSLKHISCRKDSGQSGWWQLSKFSMKSTKCHFLPPLLKLGKPYQFPFLFNSCVFADGPATVEHTHQNAGTTPDQFVF